MSNVSASRKTAGSNNVLFVNSQEAAYTDGSVKEVNAACKKSCACTKISNRNFRHCPRIHPTTCYGGGGEKQAVNTLSEVSCLLEFVRPRPTGSPGQIGSRGSRSGADWTKSLGKKPPGSPRRDGGPKEREDRGAPRVEAVARGTE